MTRAAYIVNTQTRLYIRVHAQYVRKLDVYGGARVFDPITAL